MRLLPLVAMADVQNQILEVFWWFDDEGDGIIARKELSRVLTALSPQWTTAHIDQLVQLADTNNDGRIRYREFVAWLLGTTDDFTEATKCFAGEKSTVRDATDASSIMLQLEAKQREADSIANEIARDSAIAEFAEAEANEHLEAALPALEESTSALEALEDTELQGIAGLTEPPQGLAATAQCLSVLRPLPLAHGGGVTCNQSAGCWADAQAVLQAPGLRVALRDFDRDTVSQEQVDEVRRLLSEANCAEFAEAFSPSARALLLWVQAVVRYFEASRAAAPKWQLVTKLHQRMGQAEAALLKINSEVQNLEERAKVGKQLEATPELVC